MQHDVQNKGGGGGQRLFEQCSKKLRIWWRRAPLITNVIIIIFISQWVSDKVTYWAVLESGQLKKRPQKLGPREDAQRLTSLAFSFLFPHSHQYHVGRHSKGIRFCRPGCQMLRKRRSGASQKVIVFNERKDPQRFFVAKLSAVTIYTFWMAFTELSTKSILLS